MQKWTVLVIVALLGVLLGLQYMFSKREAKVAELAKPTQPVGPAGDIMPANNIAAPTATASPAPELGKPVLATGPLGSEEIYGFQSACSGNVSLDSFVTAREGIRTLEALYDPHNTDEVFKAMNSYFTCKAVAENDLSLCDFLPARKAGGVKETPRNACAQPVKETLFTAYLAGKFPAGEADCLKRAKADSYPNPEEFCGGVLKVGMAKVCDLVPAGERKTGCLREYPAKRTDCPTESTNPCLRRYDIHAALKAGDPAGCPDGYKASCDAVLIASRGAPCSDLGDKAVKAYCSYLDFLKKKEEKKLADADYERDMALKKEQQKAMAEVNKRAREMLGKK